MLSNPRGEFVIITTRKGERKLAVKLIGYRNYETTLDIQSDLDLNIELDIEAVPVQGVTVTNRTYTIRGEVTEKSNGRPIMDVEVVLGADRRTATNLNGRFKLSKVKVGQPALVQVRAMGMLPFDAVISAESDTTLQITLDRDEIGQRIIALQITRLEKRTQAIGHSVQKLDREAILRLGNTSIYDLVRTRLRANQRAMRCLFIDELDFKLPLESLMAYLPEQIERVEIIDRGTMVRVYTRRYIEDMVRKRAQPSAAIVLIETPRGVTCK